MEILYEILKIFLYFILFFLLSLILYFFITTIKNVFFYYLRRKKMSISIIYILIKKHRYIKIVEFVKWIIIDIIRGRDRSNLFGIWAFTGYFGQGKTLGMVTFAKQLQKQYPQKNIQLCSNFSLKGQFKKIESWEDLLDLPKNTIVLFDEIQSSFTSQKFKDFPIDLLWKITQCRKQGLMIFCSTPVFHRMTIQLRENTDFIVTCSNVFNSDRWFNYRFYKAPDYERHIDNPIRLRASQAFSLSFIPQDYDYYHYDTTQIVDRMDISSNDTNAKKRQEERIIKSIQQTGAAALCEARAGSR